MSKFFSNLIRNKRINKSFFIIVVLLVAFLSFFPRSTEVLNQNPIFLFDQGREMQAAKNIVVNHKLILIGTEVGAGQAGLSGIFHGPMYYYMLTVPFVLFNGNPANVVMLMLFFGLATVLFGYYFGQKLFGKFGGLLLALLISISPVFIAQSRFIWSPNPPTFFIFVSLYFTYLLDSKKKTYIFLAAFFAGFIYNFELAVAVPLSLGLIAYSIFLFRTKIKPYLYLVLGFILGYLPMFLFEVRHNFLGFRGIVSYFTTKHDSVVASHSNLFYALDHFKSFMDGFRNTFPTNYYSYIFLFLIIAFSIYFIVSEKNIKFKHFFSYLIILIPITFLVFAPLKNTVWNIYLLHLNVVYLLLFCYIVYSFFKRKLSKLFMFSLLVIVVLSILGIVSAVKTFNHDYSDYGGTAKLKGKIDAIDYIYKDAKGKPFNLLVFTPPVYTYPYDYLIWWHGQKKYGYIPGSEKKDTFYLLIEKDPGKPWSYEGWLKTVIKEGKIIKTVTLPSGFLVQERRLEK